MLPTGSYAIKRNTRLNISLNAYVGAGATYEWATDETVPADARGFGGALHAPVGIAVSTGLADASSLSLFLVAVDLAALLAITALSVDQANGVPELKLENMLAPGGYLAYGLAESPVTIAAGIQYGPTRTITVGSTTESHQFWRVGIFGSVDIPLFNLHVR